MLFMLQIVVSDRFSRLKHAFEVKCVFPLFNNNIVVDAFKFFEQSLPLSLVTHWVTLAKFLVVVGPFILGNYYCLRISACCHYAFIVIHNDSYSTGTHTSKFLFLGLNLSQIVLIVFILELRVNFSQSVFYQLYFIILVLVEFYSILYVLF